MGDGHKGTCVRVYPLMHLQSGHEGIHGRVAFRVLCIVLDAGILEGSFAGEAVPCERIVPH